MPVLLLLSCMRPIIPSADLVTDTGLELDTADIEAPDDTGGPADTADTALPADTTSPADTADTALPADTTSPADTADTGESADTGPRPCTAPRWTPAEVWITAAAPTTATFDPCGVATGVEVVSAPTWLHPVELPAELAVSVEVGVQSTPGYNGPMWADILVQTDQGTAQLRVNLEPLE